jgi:hypothetical protein
MPIIDACDPSSAGQKAMTLHDQVALNPFARRASIRILTTHSIWQKDANSPSVCHRVMSSIDMEVFQYAAR